MRVHVVAGVYKGVLNEVFASLSAESAKDAHERICRECEVPLYCEECGADSEAERERLYNSDSDNDVQHHVVEVNASPVLEALVHALNQVEDQTTRRLVAQEFIAALNRRKLIINAEAKVAQAELMETLS